MSCNNQCKPCNSIKFDKPSGFDNRKAQERMEKQLALAKQTELSTMSCGKKIVSITRVGDTVVIMHSDCSFSTAPLSIMDVGAFTQETTRELSDTIDKLQKEREEQVKQLTELLNEGKEVSDSVKALVNETVLPEVSKISDELTKLKQNVQTLQAKPDNDTVYDDTELRTSVTALSSQLSALQNSGLITEDKLITVYSLQTKQPIYKAITLGA